MIHGGYQNDLKMFIINDRKVIVMSGCAVCVCLSQILTVHETNRLKAGYSCVCAASTLTILSTERKIPRLLRYGVGKMVVCHIANFVTICVSGECFLIECSDGVVRVDGVVKPRSRLSRVVR